METHTVIVAWGEATEFIPLRLRGKLYKKGERISTRERWTECDHEVRYTAQVQGHIKKASKHSLSLIYRLEDNAEASDFVIAWGHSILEIDLATDDVKAEWVNDAPYPGFSGLGRAKLVSEEVRAKIEYEAVRRIKRQQDRFRDQLRQRYGACVLTGESHPGLLDAAHILAAKDGGGIGIDNGLLLRTDLHRLYDEGLLQIESDGSVSLSANARVLESYRREISQLRLCSPAIAALNNARKRILSTLAK